MSTRSFFFIIIAAFMGCDDTSSNKQSKGTQELQELQEPEIPTVAVIMNGEELTVWYSDYDGDGFGDPIGSKIAAEFQPNGYVDNSTDCDDYDPHVNPLQREIVGDKIDNNCDGVGGSYESILFWCQEDGQTSSHCPGE